MRKLTRRARVLAIALLCVAVPADGQQTRSMTGPASIEVRSSDSTWRVLHVDVRARGRTLTGMAVIGGAPGAVTQDANGGRATTPVMVSAGPLPGSIRLEVPATYPRMRAVVHSDSTDQAMFVAVGHTITAVRDSTGRLTVSAAQIRSP